MTDESLFTDPERQVIRLLLQGKSNSSIALRLGLAERTVEFHLTHIYAKLRVSSRSEAVIKLLALQSDSELRESAVDTKPRTP